LTGCADGDAAAVADLVVDEPEARPQLSELSGHLGAMAPSRASRFCSPSRTTWSSAWPGSDRTSETPALGRRRDALCKALTCSSFPGTPQATPSGGNGWPTPAGALRHAPRDILHAASPAPPHNALAEDAHHPPDAPAPTPKLDLIG